jgi:superfamily II DNA or RNA helicase
MNIKVQKDNFIYFYDIPQLVELDLDLFFKKRIKKHWFNPLVKKRLWDGYINFYDKNFKRIHIGLYWQLLKFLQNKDYQIENEEYIKEYFFNKNFDLDYDSFVNEVFEMFKNSDFGLNGKKQIRDYQLETSYKILKNNHSRSILATSAGKSLIIFLITYYLLNKLKKKNVLIIVPKISLIVQMFENIKEYAGCCGRIDLIHDIKMLYGGELDRNYNNYKIIISTYQTLTSEIKKDKNYLNGIECIIIDEAHYSHTRSIKNIIINSKNCNFTTGLSGTLEDDDSLESFNLDVFLGPNVANISYKELKDNNYISPVNVKVLILDYLEQNLKIELYKIRKSTKNESTKNIEPIDILQIERKVVQESEKRLNFIIKLVSKIEKNTLILFNDVKNGYGKSIYNGIFRNIPEKTVFYIDGSTDLETRNSMKQQMETGDNKVLVASFGTFSTGVSINNLHYIIFAESFYSDKLIKQSIGRGMRLHKDKQKVTVFDLVDDFTLKIKNKITKNFLFKHGEERIKIYKNEGYNLEIKKIKI